MRRCASLLMPPPTPHWQNHRCGERQSAGKHPDKQRYQYDDAKRGVEPHRAKIDHNRLGIQSTEHDTGGKEDRGDDKTDRSHRDDGVAMDTDAGKCMPVGIG